ncbi:membrane-bound hydrophilic protein [Streptomyces viridochromogenes]|uniref:membrane-bound hydrophilic protein n=1 Tax=Streptomyces viridochromogenes TaxID=1938 RepID=UPI0002FAA315|nr:membrane-bound hydrophilic protein [Streptomyces viridochromogenes]
MPADEVTHGADVEASRVRTGPRHAAPKKPLFTRFHMPAGKAMALAAMPTAVLMGMGFTSTLAQADSNDSSKLTSNNLKADEYDEYADQYKECVAALEGAENGSASPSPSSGAGDLADQDDTPEPTPSASAGQDSSNPSDTTGSSGSAGDSASSDSGSDDAAEPTPTPSPSKTGEAQSGDTATPSPAPSESGGNLLEDIGDAITGIFTGGPKPEETASPTPTPSASASEETSSGSSDSGKDTAEASDSAEETAEKVTDTVRDTTESASKAVEDTTGAAQEAAGEVTASPTPSASPTPDAEDCPAATDDESGVDNKVPVADDPWYLQASSLLLKGADYQGIVEVKTANGTKKKVLKYVISDGTDIGDLHQLVNDKQSGKTYHVQASKGSTSTIRGGQTVMYTESISGNLLGLIPVTFDPEHPPPLNIPLIYFTNVKVTQAAQFGGTLHVPGMHVFTTD